MRVLLLDEGAGEVALGRAGHAVCAEIGDACYSTNGRTLAETLVHAASEAGLTIATAESCTGGMVCAAVTDVPGASSVLLGGVVAYANTAKIDLLSVPAGLLAQYGAVSEETARAMAEGARVRFGADIAVSTTGIAGPGGATPEKPVGTRVVRRLHRARHPRNDEAHDRCRSVRRALKGDRCGARPAPARGTRDVTSS